MPEFNDAAEPDKKPEKKPAAKMKTSSTKGDVIDKGKTITGSKPDTININPELQRNEARAFAEIAKIYDKVVGESINSAGGGAVRGLGYVTGNPLTDQDSENNYINANIANADTHDNILKGIRGSMHDTLHAKFTAAAKAVKENLDIINTHNREVGTDSLTQIYKASTPGQGVNMDFAFRFKDPKKSKEAFTRSGQPRKKMDLVPRMDPGRNRSTDSDFYRQQSIVKKIVDETFNEAFGKSRTQGKGYKSPWDKIEKAKPGIGKRIDTAVAGLKQNAKDYENIVNKEKTNEELVSELTKKFMNNFVAKMIASHPETMKMTAKGHNVKRKKALDLAMDKLNPMSAIHKPKVLATEENLDEISKELVGRVNTLRTLGPDVIKGIPPKPHKTKAGYETLKKAVDKAAGVKRVSTYTLPKVTEDATTEKDPFAHLENRLNKAGDVSHNAVDKIMREVAKDFNMDVHDLHDKWVNKYKMTPDQYVKEDLRDWFKDKWVRMDTKGNIKGDCAREPGEGKPKCLPIARARSMSKDDRAAAVRRKRREDPVADRSGKGNAPINVRTEAANPAQQAAIAIALIKAGKKKGKMPPARKHTNEEIEYIEEKNKPTNPSLWLRAKSLARQKFDVYPSAYANGWAAKWYKSKGGGWKAD